jgi:hypothetical protein
MLIVGAVAALAATCGDRQPASVRDAATPTAPAQSVRRISDARLQEMLLTPHALPYKVALPTSEGPRAFDNARAAAESFDPNDTEWDMKRRGRLTGYSIEYDTPLDADLTARTGTHGAYFSVELWEDADAARAFVEDEIVAATSYVGTSLATGYTIHGAELFSPEGFDQASYGARFHMLDSLLGDVYLSVIVFQHDELVASAVVERLDPSDAGAETYTLARLLDDTINGGSTPPPASALVPGGVLGLRCSYASRYLRELYGLSPRRGCVILRVSGPAQRVGLRVGDKIVRVNDWPITSGAQFSAWWDLGISGPRPLFVVERDGAEIAVELPLGESGPLPQDDPYQAYLAARGNPDAVAAVRYYTEALQFAPDFDLARLYRAQRMFDERLFADRLDDAVADVELVLESDPLLVEAYVLYADVKAFYGDPSAAIALLDTAATLAECQSPVPEWDYDCMDIVIARATYALQRLQPGDIDRASADLASLAGISAPSIADAVWQLQLQLESVR